jgi:hypothetical protein
MVIPYSGLKRVAAFSVGLIILLIPAIATGTEEVTAEPPSIETSFRIDPEPVTLQTPIIGPPLQVPTPPVVARVEKPKTIPKMSATELSDLQREAQTLVIIAWGLSEWDAFNWIIKKESGWNFQAVNKSSAATGLCQSLPAKKMASAGPDYLTNPTTQVKWCISYIKQRYGTPSKAQDFHKSHNWF